MSASTIIPCRFLFVLFEGGGSVTPTLGLAKRLVERGHHVRVISDTCNEPEVKAAGCEFTAYSRAPNRKDKSAASTFINDYEFKNQLTALRTILKIFFDPGYAEDVLAELTVRPVDVCVVNDFLLGALFAPEKAGIPAVLLAPQRLNSRLSPPGVGLRDKASVLAQEFLFQHIVFRAATRDLRNTRKALDLAPIPSIFSYLHNLPRILIMTSRAFDFTAKPGPNMRFIGPMLDDPTWAENWQPPWSPDHPDPLIVVGLSTAYQKQEELLQKIMDAMDGLPVRGLVTLGPALEHAQFNVASNMVVRRSVPHAKVFPFASAVVTHCGHGTVMRALAHGVPVVGIPFGRDQDGNARRVVALGAGLQLDRQADVASIRTAIQRVIGERAFRDNARELGIIISEDARNSTGVQELEQVASKSKSILSNI